MYDKKVIVFSGSSGVDRSTVLDNFDNNARNKKDDYSVLVTTDVLSE